MWPDVPGACDRGNRAIFQAVDCPSHRGSKNVMRLPDRHPLQLGNPWSTRAKVSSNTGTDLLAKSRSSRN